MHRFLPALPLVALLAACAATPEYAVPPHVTLASVEPAAQAGQVVLQLNLKNETDAVMPVAGMDYRLVFEGVEFAWGVSRQPVNVPASGVAMFDVIVSGTLPDVQPGVGGHRQLAYRLSGTIYLTDGRGQFPYVHDGMLTWQAAAGQ